MQQGSGGYITRIRKLLAGYVWYRCYHLHQSRDALSPVCGIFLRGTNQSRKENFKTFFSSSYISNKILNNNGKCK